MIRIETITINNKSFIKTYSDENRYVVRNGFSYSEAIDPIDSKREYIEGDIIKAQEELIQENNFNDSDEATIKDYQDALTEFGVEI